MGRHHARACAETSDVDLVAVCDPQESALDSVAKELGCPGAKNTDAFADKIDMAIIAVPTQLHASVAVPLLRSGISCLIEKPIAVSEDNALDILQTAADSGAILKVGHIERFNPAITALRQSLPKNARAESLTAERCNPPQDRDYDADAVLDLMIHDLDLMRFLGLADVIPATGTIQIEGVASFHTATANLKLTNGGVARFDVDREAASPRRTLSINSENTTYSVDFNTREVTVVDNTGETAVPVGTADALRAQLTSFVSAVRGGPSDTASGEDALTALRLANSVRTAAGLSA